MSRFNTATPTGTRSPITSTVADVTAKGGSGFARDARSELFLLAVSNMTSKGDAFHEGSTARDARYADLLRQVAADTEWVLGFVQFLRNKANMRSASIIAAAEVVKARLDAKVPGGRDIISAALQRADEPGEMLAYWTANFGRNVPWPVKRGINDAIDRLYTERSYLKWDSDARSFRMADVLQITHPSPTLPWKSALYGHMLNERYKGAVPLDGESPLKTLVARQKLMALPVEERRNVTSGQLQEAAMTWEAYAGWVQGELDAAAWEKLIPNMGYMALLRNLRNLDQKGISRAARREVEDRLTDPEQVAKSRQLPMRFLSAYRATRDSGTVTAWGPVIEEALNKSLANVPSLKGRTAIYVDVSGSMQSPMSDRSGLRFVDAAAVFGAALALRAEDATLVAFQSTVIPIQFKRTDSLLPLSEKIAKHLGGGTATANAIQATYSGQDRIIIVTDEQTDSGGYSYGGYYGGGYGAQSVSDVLDRAGVPAYTWNLNGYRVGHAESGKLGRHTFGGLSDAAFRMIPLIEQGTHADWKALFSDE